MLDEVSEENREIQRHVSGGKERHILLDAVLEHREILLGHRGVEENPNRHAGSTGASSPRATPSSDPARRVTARRSVAP